MLLEPAEEGGFIVTCPVLPGLATEGDTLEEARAMAQNAIRAYLESLRKDHLPIPSDTLGSIIHQAGYTNNEFLELLKWVNDERSFRRSAHITRQRPSAQQIVPASAMCYCELFGASPNITSRK